MSSFDDDARDGITPTLIQTKLHRPRLGPDLIARPHLIEQLNQGLERKLTLISAQAGAGKSTLLAQWLQECPQQSAWLSIDEDDNDLMVFVSYLCAAIQTIFPDGCKQTLDLQHAPVTPPTRIITTSLVNELVDLYDSRHPSDDDGHGTVGMILALDDYHTIKEPTIHELVSDLIKYLPQCVQVALSTRIDPPLPLAGLRARKEMVELRTNDLQLATEEAGKLLEMTAGRKLSNDTIDLLLDKTEGWVVGLRLAALSIRNLPDKRDYTQNLVGANSSIIADYLISEVLSQQSATHQKFLLRSSILKRFNAELCDAVLRFEDDDLPAVPEASSASSHAILKALRSANLFLLSLDQEERWFRYHHLFRDLLQHRLRQQHEPETIKILHSRASQWFEDKGFIEEALTHAFSAGDLDRAAQIVSRQRYRLMNQTSWPQLERYLRRFPSRFARQQPDLLMLKAWLFHHSGNYEQLPEVLVKIEAAMAQSALSLEAIRHLKGEMSALVSLLSYYGLDGEQTLTVAEFSIKNTPPELWVVRVLARLFLAGSYQMRGELNRAYETIFRAADEEDYQSNRFRAPTMMTSCYIYWLAADLNGLMQVAKQCLELFDYPHSAEFEGFVHYHLGCAHLQRLELSAAEEQFEVVVKEPHLNYGECYAHSAFGLSLTHLAQGRAEDARQVASAVVDFALETTNSTILSLAKAFQAEIALREGQLATAGQWAHQFKTVPPLSAMVQLYQYQLTLVRIWLAYDSPDMRRQAAELLGQLELYAESTHNTLFLIEVKALLAVLYAAEDDKPAALAQLEGAIAVAQPGGIIRTFVDLGPPMADLLQTLHGQGVSPDYRSQYLVQIMSAFPGAALGQNQLGASGRPDSAQVLVDPLTSREVEVLELLVQRLTNKEIAERLLIAPGTVKTHTLNIYAKLQVAGRRQAVEKAIQIGLLSYG